MVSHKRSLDQNEKEGDCSNKTIPIATATEEVLVKKRRDGGEANIEEDDLFHALDHQNMLTCQMYDTVSEEEQIVNDSNKEDDLFHISNIYKELTCQLYDELDDNDSCFSGSDTNTSMDEDIEFDTDDEEEIDDDLNMVLRSSLELLQHQHNNTIQELEVLKQQQHNYIEENSALKAKVLTLTNIIQQLQRQLQSSNTVGVTRQRVLKVVEDIAVKYIDYHSWDIGTRSKINNLIKSGHLDGLREIIQKEHAELDQDHRFAKDLMTDNQLYSFVYRLTNEYREKSKRKTLEKLAKKKAILDKIIDDLERNAQFLNPNQAAYVIQCIFDVARLHPDTAEATSKMLTAILVQIQEFGDVGLEFLNSWGVTPLTEKFIEEFKADKDNWPYLQAGYYVGLTSTVEYMNVQTDGIRPTVGAWETVRQIALNLGLSPAQVRNLGAISDSLFICLCRGSASFVEAALQTFFKGMYILAPRNKPHSREVCVVSLQKIHDSGASSETIGDGDGTKASGVFITCIPGHAATTNARNTDGKFKIIDSFMPQTPVPTFPNAKVPQGFGRGGTKPE